MVVGKSSNPIGDVFDSPSYKYLTNRLVSADEACSTQSLEEAPVSERKYQYTIADLIDRLSISLMKSIFLPDNRKSYLAEMEDIKQDLATCFNDTKIAATPYGHAQLLYACLVLMLSNRYIWENEAVARKSGKGGRLWITHSINGVRNRAKNEISKMFGQRVDHKIDCLAADLPGNWDVFNDGPAPTSEG
jgi:hypothetical protein